MVWFKTSRVFNDIEMSGRDSSLSHRLTDQEEIVPTCTRIL